jgi:hypothetical protein
MNEVPHPWIVSRDRWLDARKKLLAQEKELTRQYDRVNAERRRLPMVRIRRRFVAAGRCVHALMKKSAPISGNVRTLKIVTDHLGGMIPFFDGPTGRGLLERPFLSQTPSLQVALSM